MAVSDPNLSITEEIENQGKNRKASVKSVFKNRDYSKLWIGQFISNTGSSLSFIVLPLFMFFYTGSTLWLGMITLMQLIPVLILSPIAGVFVDTHNRKTIMISSDILNALFIFMIPVLITFDKEFPKNYILIGILLMVFFGSTINRFFMPAREASIPHLVKSDELSIAVSISQTTFQLIMVIGPIIGTIIATLINFSFAFEIDGLTFIFSALTILFIKADLKPKTELNQNKNSRPSLLLGTKKVFQIKTLRFIVIIFMFLIFANASLNSFLVAYAEQDLQMTKIQFGMGVSILGGSAVLTGIALTGIITKVKRPLALISGTFFAGGIILLPLLIITQAWELYVILFLLGPVNILINVPGDVIFYRDTVDSYRGQVFSALNMLISLFSIFGIFYGVIFVSFFGLRYLFFSNALIFVTVGFFALFYLFFINNLDIVDNPINSTKSPTTVSN